MRKEGAGKLNLLPNNLLQQENKETELYSAIKNAEFEKAKSILNKINTVNIKGKEYNFLLKNKKINKAINQQNENDGKTPLHAAVTIANSYFVEELLDKGADVNIKVKKGVLPINEFPIRRYYEHNRASMIEIVKALLEKHNENDFDKNNLNKLVKRVALLNSTSLDSELIKLKLFDDGKSSYMGAKLLYLISKNKFPLVKDLLLKHKFEDIQLQYKVLKSAIKSGSTEIINLLAQHSFTFQYDVFKYEQPVVIALKSRNDEVNKLNIINYLYCRGAEISIAPYGVPLIHFAISQRSLLLVRFFVEKDKNCLNALDQSNQNTPLTAAVLQYKSHYKYAFSDSMIYDIIDFLLDNGAKFNEEFQYETPIASILDIVNRANHKSAYELSTLALQHTYSFRWDKIIPGLDNKLKNNLLERNVVYLLLYCNLPCIFKKEKENFNNLSLLVCDGIINRTAMIEMSLFIKNKYGEEVINQTKLNNLFHKFEYNKVNKSILDEFAKLLDGEFQAQDINNKLVKIARSFDTI